MPKCPSCQSETVYRSRTRPGWERWRREVTLKVPFRCHDCGRRFWRPDRATSFSREAFEAANRAIAALSFDEEIATPARPISDPEIAALDARFSLRRDPNREADVPEMF